MTESKVPAIVPKGGVLKKDTLSALLTSDSFMSSVKAVLPKHLTPERIVKMVLVAASRNPRIFQCTQQSILQAVMSSAELGLDCSGTLGEAYVIPYWNSKIRAYECQFMIGYRGLISLARRSGQIARIEARVVYQDETFEVEYGLNPKLVHKPCMDGVREKEKMVCAYAVCELTDGSQQVEVMTLKEIEGIRNRSKAKDLGPWKTDFAEMARKTVIRRIAKYLPLSPELVTAFEADDKQFAFNMENFGRSVEAAAAVGISGLKQRLSGKEEKPLPEPEPDGDKDKDKDKAPPLVPPTPKELLDKFNKKVDKKQATEAMGSLLLPNDAKDGEFKTITEDEQKEVYVAASDAKMDAKILGEILGRFGFSKVVEILQDSLPAVLEAIKKKAK